MNLYVTGIRSSIVRSFVELLNKKEKSTYEPFPLAYDYSTKILGQGNRYILAQGKLLPKKFTEHSETEVESLFLENLVLNITWSEKILAKDPGARICLIGSHSANTGSHNMLYAVLKAALHRYVELRTTDFPEQQLVAVAPSIIWDSHMTQSRTDLERVLKRAKKNPKSRVLMAEEVADTIYYLLFGSSGYINNCVIPITGGER